MIFEAGLILEGGGMRGVYTAGVLDFFMDVGICLSHCYSVSAGAVNATNYLSHQRGRTFRITANYINDKRYCSAKNLLTTGDLFGADFLYNRIPNELDPFDYNAFETSESRMTAVVTNVVTGEPEYKALTDLRQEMQWLRASCSLPLLAKIVELEGGHYLDGGISDSIPLLKSMQDGNRKNIVILTRHGGYQKQPEGMTSLLGSLLYRKYPQTLAAGKQRHLMYNRQLALVAEQERLGNTLVICPKEPVTIGRAEKDTKKLTALYEQGYADAKEKLDQIMDFLEIKQQRGFLSGIALLVSCALIFSGCAAPVQEQPAEPVTIKIVHTNDIHGRSAYQEDSVVGFEKLAALIAQEQPALVLDVGDTFHGQAFATLEQGTGMAELLKSVKYDAMPPRQPRLEL